MWATKIQADEYGRVYTTANLPALCGIATGAPPRAVPRVVQAFHDPLAGTQAPFSSKNNPQVHRISGRRRFASQPNTIPLDCDVQKKHVQVPMPSKTLTHALAHRLDPSVGEVRRRAGKLDKARDKLGRAK